MQNWQCGFATVRSLHSHEGFVAPVDLIDGGLVSYGDGVGHFDCVEYKTDGESQDYPQDAKH